MPLDPTQKVAPPLGASLLKVSGIRKEFPGVLAICNADLELRGGEIHALVGANGAGKSTLVKVLTGVIPPDSGELTLEGAKTEFHGTADSMAAGITAIFQEFSLVPALSIRSNLFLGNETTQNGLIKDRQERQRAQEILEQLGLSQSPDSLVRDLSVANQQLVEIARALLRNARILILDEPTASLSPREVDRLFPILRRLADQGIAILFISHRLEEILSIATRVTVMRDGETIENVRVDGLSRDWLIERMVGHTFSEEFPKRGESIGETGFEVRHFSGSGVFDVSFSVRRGEVLGLAGLVGAGRTELARLIFGADRKESGELRYDSGRINICNPYDAVRAGIGLLTEDRKSQGLVLNATVQFNFALGNLRRWSSLGWIDQCRESEHFGIRARELNMRVSGSEQLAAQLSGGNQQNLLVARWLETDCRVLIFDEPTRGIDVGAKREMYFLIRRLANEGKIIIVISSEFPELLGLCDRILVMRRGRITGVIDDVTATTQESIMAMAV